MTSEKYEFEYCNLINANEKANKHSILRQRQMVTDIRSLQSTLKAKNEIIDELVALLEDLSCCGGLMTYMGFNYSSMKNRLEQAIKKAEEK